MLLTIILLVLLLYAAWKWWTYFCLAVYLADHISKHGVHFPSKQEFKNYANARASEILSNFLKS